MGQISDSEDTGQINPIARRDLALIRTKKGEVLPGEAPAY